MDIREGFRAVAIFGALLAAVSALAAVLWCAILIFEAGKTLKTAFSLENQRPLVVQKRNA